MRNLISRAVSRPLTERPFPATAMISLFRPDQHGVRPGYAFLRLLCKLAFYTYFRGKVFGVHHVPREGGAVLAANHQSHLDPIVAGVAISRECGFMARDSLFHNRYFGRLIRYLNAFPVKRGASDVGALKELLRRLKQGELVVIFPAGTRSLDGSIPPVNAKTLAAAKHAGVPIIPTMIDGAFDAMPRANRIPRPARIHVIYAQPIAAAEVGAMSAEEIAEAVTQRLLEAQAVSKRFRARLR